MKDESTEHGIKLDAGDKTMVFSAKRAEAHVGASLIALAGWEIGRRIQLSGGAHSMGRALSNDTMLNAASVSRESGRRPSVIVNAASICLSMSALPWRRTRAATDRAHRTAYSLFIKNNDCSGVVETRRL